METREVRLVDAFAAEPFGGVPVPVVAGDALDDDRLRALAGEFGAPGAITRGDNPRYVSREGVRAPVTAAVAGGVGLLAAGALDAGEWTVARAGDDAYSIEVGTDRTVAVGLPEQSVATVSGLTDEAASALGIEATALRAVESLPVGRAGQTLVVPVSYLEHLTAATPDDGALAAVFGESDVERALAFTFDTLGQETDIHARVFAAETDPHRDSSHREVAASGLAGAACGAYLAAFDAFDGDREAVRVESGHVLDSPAELTTTLAASPRVTGSGLVTFEGSVTLPGPRDDDIVEL